MSALTQYLELYELNRKLVCNNSVDTLNKFRDEAFDHLSKAGLPDTHQEKYRHTDLNKLLSTDYGINLARVPIDVNPAASFKCDVPNMSTALFFLINDIPASTQNATHGLPDNIFVGSIKEGVKRYPEIVEKYYGSIAKTDNPLTALNTLFAQDGFMLYVPRGVKVEKTLQLVNILQNTAPLMAVRRLLIIIEENASAKLLVCDHTQNPDTDFLSLQTIEIIAEQGSHFDFYDLEESTPRTNRLSTLYVKQQRDSNVLVNGITLYNGYSRNEYLCDLDEENAHLELLGMGIEDDKRVLDTQSAINHNAPHCHSNELFKYVADDEARAIFSGRIYVAPGAVGTEAYQSNRNILGNDTAHIFTNPELEIYNDDVKCSHGAAIGQLDENQIFYMRTRGIDLDAAKLLLKQAFMADVIGGIRVPALAERLRILVEHRFMGSDSSCNSCGADCASLMPNA